MTSERAPQLRSCSPTGSLVLLAIIYLAFVSLGLPDGVFGVAWPAMRAGLEAPLEAAGRLGRSVAVHESMPYALYAFLRHPGSYENCLFCAVMSGGDRDTLGAMACAISGAYLGVEAIPWFWLDKLERRRQIEELALKLARMKVGPVSGLPDEDEERREQE